MRAIAVLTMLPIFALVAMGMGQTREATKENRIDVQVLDLRGDIRETREKVWMRQSYLGIERSPTAFRERATRAVPYLRWIRSRWNYRAYKTYKLVRWVEKPEGAIRFVFGRWATQALAVASCESGWSMTPRAQNGQYLGMFQMGTSERATYGHGHTPLEQARAAYRYFVDSGKDWSPWSCKPW